MEQIVRIEFADNTLEEKKKIIIAKIIAHEQLEKDLDIISYTKDNIAGLLESLENIRNDHFKNLNQSEKKKLIEDVILNLRLPKLLEQREHLKKRISEMGNSQDLEKYIKIHEKITKEINLIKKRDY